MSRLSTQYQSTRAFQLQSGVQRYGFNGQEFETELDASNSTFSAEFWMYSSGIVSRWDLDPKRKSDASAYQILLSSPILYIDPKGDTTIVNLFHSKEPAKFHFAAKRYLENDKDQPRDNVFVVCAHGNSGLVIFPDKREKVVQSVLLKNFQGWFLNLRMRLRHKNLLHSFLNPVT